MSGVVPDAENNMRSETHTRLVPMGLTVHWKADLTKESNNSSKSAGL